jgi:hypothetical protein
MHCAPRSDQDTLPIHWAIESRNRVRLPSVPEPTLAHAIVFNFA